MKQTIIQISVGIFFAGAVLSMPFSIITAQKDSFFQENLVSTDQAEDVERLQEILESEGLFCEGCNVTGYFGYWTQAGLMNLQERYELSITGIVDKETRAKLNEIIGPVEPEQAPLSLPESSISPEVIDHPINQEQSIASSLIVQELELQIIQLEPEQAPLSLPESSISPEVIDHPINQEQSIAFSLIVQELELQIIQLQMQIAEFTEQLAVFLAENSIATAQVDFSFEKTLVLTDQAEDVSRLQEILESEGLYCLGCQVTGYFGYWTQAGLMDLQERYELSITGIVDEVTRVKLNELVGLAGSQGQPVPKEPDPSTETDVSTDSDEPTSIEDLEELASASSPTPSPTPSPAPSGGGSPSSSAPDATAPSAITDLATSNPTSSSVILSWTAPGDDESTGTAARYIIKLSTVPITTATWQSANFLEYRVLKTAGSAESMTVSGLSAGTTYYFVLRTHEVEFDVARSVIPPRGEVPNKSLLSNMASTTTLSAADIIAPSYIIDLVALNRTSSSVILSWTAPGDDESTGTAASYEIVYSTNSEISKENWRVVTQVSGESAPKIAGATEIFTISGLSASTSYNFRMRTSDEAPNWSKHSNELHIQTLSPEEDDTSLPGPVADLAVSNPTTSSLDLSWTASGDNGDKDTATSYDIRYSTSWITQENWDSTIQVSDEPIPQPPGSSETFTVSGLSAGITYYFLVRVLDEAGNESVFSNATSAETSSASPSPDPVACGTIAAGKQIYFVSTQNMPQIMQIDLDPQDVQLGATQTVTVKIRDTNDNAITQVSGTANIDSGSVNFSFSLVAGTDLNGTWEGSWSSASSICTTYTIQISVTGTSGQSIVDLSLI